MNSSGCGNYALIKVNDEKKKELELQFFLFHKQCCIRKLERYHAVCIILHILVTLYNWLTNVNNISTAFMNLSSCKCTNALLKSQVVFVNIS